MYLRFPGLNLMAGCIQIGINVFVSLSWKDGLQESSGLAALLTALAGTIVPIILAAITLNSVIIPALIR